MTTDYKTRRIDMIMPEGWRKGQTISNFIEWLKSRSAVDPFYILDEDWDRFYFEFITSLSQSKKEEGK